MGVCRTLFLPSPAGARREDFNGSFHREGMRVWKMEEARWFLLAGRFLSIPFSSTVINPGKGCIIQELRSVTHSTHCPPTRYPNHEQSGQSRSSG